MSTPIEAKVVASFSLLRKGDIVSIVGESKKAYKVEYLTGLGEGDIGSHFIPKVYLSNRITENTNG